jgi:hypothetical protein
VNGHVLTQLDVLYMVEQVQTLRRILKSVQLEMRQACYLLSFFDLIHVSASIGVQRLTLLVC